MMCDDGEVFYVQTFARGKFFRVRKRCSRQTLPSGRIGEGLHSCFKMRCIGFLDTILFIGTFPVILLAFSVILVCSTLTCGLLGFTLPLNGK